jgi:hypothetical protein
MYMRQHFQDKLWSIFPNNSKNVYEFSQIFPRYLFQIRSH